jgi:hypothetical protein
MWNARIIATSAESKKSPLQRPRKAIAMRHSRPARPGGEGPRQPDLVALQGPPAEPPPSCTWYLPDIEVPEAVPLQVIPIE